MIAYPSAHWAMMAQTGAAQRYVFGTCIRATAQRRWGANKANVAPSGWTHLLLPATGPFFAPV